MVLYSILALTPNPFIPSSDVVYLGLPPADPTPRTVPFCSLPESSSDPLNQPTDPISQRQSPISSPSSPTAKNGLIIALSDCGPPGLNFALRLISPPPHHFLPSSSFVLLSSLFPFLPVIFCSSFIVNCRHQPSNPHQFEHLPNFSSLSVFTIWQSVPISHPIIFIFCYLFFPLSPIFPPPFICSLLYITSHSLSTLK